MIEEEEDSLSLRGVEDDDAIFLELLLDTVFLLLLDPSTEFFPDDVPRFWAILLEDCFLTEDESAFTEDEDDLPLLDPVDDFVELSLELRMTFSPEEEESSSFADVPLSSPQAVKTMDKIRTSRDCFARLAMTLFSLAMLLFIPNFLILYSFPAAWSKTSTRNRPHPYTSNKKIDKTTSKGPETKVPEPV